MKKNQFYTILLFGSLWGITEATIGYACHALSRYFLIPGISGFFLFPAAFYFMYRAFKKTGMVSAPLWVASIAASVKLLNFMLPHTSPVEILNPVFAILAESALTFFVFKLNILANEKRFAINVISLSFAWRLLFLGILILSPLNAGLSYYADKQQLLSFLFIDSLINGLFITLIYFKVFSFFKTESPKEVSPYMAVFSFLLAAGVTIILS